MSKPLHLLLVEDCEDDAWLLLREVQKAGYKVHHQRVEQPQELASALAERSWDAIIADFKLPQFDALEALRIVQLNGADVPFIIVSGAVGEELAVGAMKAGAHDYVSKNNLTRLVPAIERELREAAGRRQRRHAEAKSAYQASLLANIHDAVIATDEHGVLTAWNHAAENLYGWREEETIGRRMDQFIPSELNQEERADVQSKLAQRGRYDWEAVHYRQDGQPIHVAGTSMALHGDHRELTGFVHVARDVTARVEAEEVLCRSEERFFKVFRSSPAAIAIVAINDGRLIEINDCFADFFGYRREELIGQKAPELQLWADSAERQQMIERVRTRGAIRNLETRFRTRGGEARTVLLSMEAISLPAQPVLIEMFLDITERKRAEYALRESEQRFRQLAENIGEVFWLIDSKTEKMIYVSPAYEKIWGRTCESLYNDPQSRKEAIHPEDRARVAESEHLLGTRADIYRIVRSDGAIRWIRDRAFPVKDEMGEIIRVAGIAEDITESQRAEEALKNQTEILQTIFDHIPVMILLLDRSGRLKMANREWEQTLGWTVPELEKREDVLSELYPDPEYRQFILEFVQAAERRWLDCKTRIRDGRLIDTSWANVRLSDGSLLGIGQDITERKHVEADLRQTTERLQALSHRLLEVQETERRHLARELHDQVGQALTALKINVQALQRFPDPHSLASRLEDSVRIIDRLLNQVRNLSLDLRPPLLDDLGLLAALRWYVNQQASRAGWKAHFAADLPDTRLEPSLETTCFRIAQEAITNIIRHAQAKNVHVELRCEATVLHLAVIDDGIGFDVGTTEARAAHGMSLGWIGMQERATLVGGQLFCKSTPRQGTELHAYFPLTRPVTDSETQLSSGS